MGFFSRKEYSLADTVAFARKVGSTDMTCEVGWPVRITTPGGVRTIAGFSWSQADYDKRILDRLDAFARQSLQQSGRCEVQLDVGNGKVAAEIEPTKARLILA
ncbi:MAG TPA: hypothetical protein VLH12_03780 [Usitatibacter sp.]|nr:hypothetical protein [Usitatibacter sp.]